MAELTARLRRICDGVRAREIRLSGVRCSENLYGRFRSWCELIKQIVFASYGYYADRSIAGRLAQISGFAIHPR
jgi:hypothetical protein